MAGGGLVVAANDGEEYHGKLTCFVILASMMAAMGGLIFGYDIGISGLIFHNLYTISIVQREHKRMFTYFYCESIDVFYFTNTKFWMM